MNFVQEEEFRQQLAKLIKEKRELTRRNDRMEQKILRAAMGPTKSATQERPSQRGLSPGDGAGSDTGMDDGY